MEAITTRALRKIYPPPAKNSIAGVVAVDALDLIVAEGEFFGMLGPNGAGKTTTIGILTTRVRPTAGEAFVAGVNVVTEPAAGRGRNRGVPTPAEARPAWRSSGNHRPGQAARTRHAGKSEGESAR